MYLLLWTEGTLVHGFATLKMAWVKKEMLTWDKWVAHQTAEPIRRMQ